MDRAWDPQGCLVAEATVKPRPRRLWQWRVLEAAETPRWSDCRDNVTRRLGELQLDLGSAQELGLAGVWSGGLALGSRRAWSTSVPAVKGSMTGPGKEQVNLETADLLVQVVIHLCRGTCFGG